MTNITISTEKKLGREMYIVELAGHAGYNPGNDIVCSALSILMYTLGESLLQKKIEADINIQSGYAKIQCENTKEIEDIVFTIENGFKLLNDRYPMNVIITKKCK